MRVAITAFGPDVSPLFDTAQVILLVQMSGGEVHHLERISLGCLGLSSRLALLTDRGVQVLVCGAIRSSAHRALLERGIMVHPWVSGEVDEVLGFMAARYRTGEEEVRDREAEPRKVAVSSHGPDIDAAVDPCFRRCRFLLLVGPGDASVSLLGSSDMEGGLGPLRSARLILDAGARVLLTGRCGPNTLGTLSASGIQVYLGLEGTVQDAVERYRRGDLVPSNSAVASRQAKSGAGGLPHPAGVKGRGLRCGEDGTSGSRGEGRGGRGDRRGYRAGGKRANRDND